MAEKFLTDFQGDFHWRKNLNYLVGKSLYNAGFVWMMVDFFLELKHELGPEVADCQVHVLL